MILLDVNVLVRAHRPELPESKDADKWLVNTIQGTEKLACWEVVLVSAFRILTHPRMVVDSETPRRAFDFLEQVRSVSVPVGPGTMHWRLVRQLIEASNARGNLVTDAMIAAVAIENNCRLATYDRDFGKFPFIQWFEPTASSSS